MYIYYGGKVLAQFKLKTWQCDELSARRSRFVLGPFSTLETPVQCASLYYWPTKVTIRPLHASMMHIEMPRDSHA